MSCILIVFVYVAFFVNGVRDQISLECDMADNEAVDNINYCTGDVSEQINSTNEQNSIPQLIPEARIIFSKAIAAPQVTINSEFQSEGVEGHYRYAAVSSDAGICSTIGTDMMAKRGATAIDAAVATSLCRCIYHFQSCGIGGGFFMTVYDREKKEAYAIIAREMAPEGAYKTMFNGRSSKLGGLAIAIPGELKGLWLAHQIGGKLPWKDLVQPSIQLCRDGMAISIPTAIAIESNLQRIDRFPTLKKLLTNPETKTYFKEGEIIYRPELANTLEIIAKEGADAFYNGSLTDAIAADIQETGGIITKDDLNKYTALKTDPVVLKLNKNLTVFAPPPPSGGAVYEFVLNILEGYNLTSESISTEEKAIQTWHRIIEAFKFAAAEKTKLCDSMKETKELRKTVKKVLDNLKSKAYAEKIRSKISEKQTFPTSYYGPNYHDPSVTGTSHLSILAANGDAVSVTSTINYAFGSKIVGSRTGIIFNNEMNDFSIPNKVDPTAPANYIKPHKRPHSSMCPVIIVDKTGMVKLIAGASGGTRAITSTALVTLFVQWLGMSIKQAIDHKRVYHILTPNTIFAETGFSEHIIDGLRQKGHNVTFGVSSVVQGILQKEEGKISAYADYRKRGSTDGF